MVKTTRKNMPLSTREKKSSVFGSTTLIASSSLIAIFLATQCYLILSFIKRGEHIHRAVSVIACDKGSNATMPEIVCSDGGKTKLSIEKGALLSSSIISSTDDHKKWEPEMSAKEERSNSEENMKENEVCPSFSGKKVEINEKEQFRNALVVFATPRTGSTTLQSMMQEIDRMTSSEEFHLLAQGGIFSHDVKGYFPILSTMRLLAMKCESNIHPSRRKDDLQRLREIVQEEKWEEFQQLMKKLESTKRLLNEFRERFKSVSKYLRYMRSVLPQISKRPFFAFKLFDFHLKKNGADMPVDKFVQELKDTWRKGSDGDTLKVIVLWRRCMIEQFVSNKIAANRKKFMALPTTEKDAIHVDKHELEEYIKKKRRYYLNVQKALVDNGVSFEVFEYDRDIKNDSSKFESRKRLLEMLGLSSEEQEDERGKLAKTKKQAIAPLNKLILNFEEVKAWGYVRPLDEWEDLFSDHTDFLGVQH